jgi:hemerythrin
MKSLLTHGFSRRKVRSPAQNSMNSIPIWHSGLCVRNPPLDAQHIIILELGRELLRVLELQPICEESVLVLLCDIAGVAHKHHVMEEEFLKANACPTLKSIVTAHSAVQDMLDGMIADVRQQSADLGALARQISAWMHVHIYETDMPVRAFLVMPRNLQRETGNEIGNLSSFCEAPKPHRFGFDEIRKTWQ